VRKAPIYTAAGGEVHVHLVVFTSNGRQNKEINTWTGKANVVLRELYRSVDTKRELSNTANMSVFNSVSFPMLTYGNESWVLTEIVVSQIQDAEM